MTERQTENVSNALLTKEKRKKCTLQNFAKCLLFYFFITPTQNERYCFYEFFKSEMSNAFFNVQSESEIFKLFVICYFVLSSLLKIISVVLTIRFSDVLNIFAKFKKKTLKSKYAEKIDNISRYLHSFKKQWRRKVKTNVQTRQDWYYDQITLLLIVLRT